MTTLTAPYKYIKPAIIIELGALLMNDMKSPKDCKNDLSTTKMYLAQMGIDSDFYLRWFGKHGVSCDCDVIMDIALPLYEHANLHGPEPWFLNDMFLPETSMN